MPEGPECRIAAENLREYVFNDNASPVLVDMVVVGGRYVKTGISDTVIASTDVKGNLIQCSVPSIVGLSIIDISYHGKLIYIKLSGEVYIIITFGMTGSFQFFGTKQHQAVMFDFGREKNVAFVDPRHMGTVIVGDERYFRHRMKALGVSVFSEAFTVEYLVERIRSKKKDVNVCKFLMDQSNVAGVGNYVKSEVLYIAGVCPTVTIQSLDASQLDDLVKAIKKVVNESYDDGGMSVKDFYHLDGSVGTYTEKLSVYGKKVDPFGVKVTSILTDDKRTTWYVEDAC